MASIKSAAKALMGKFLRAELVPPSRRPNLAPQEPVPIDPAEHAAQFAEVWFDRFEFHVRGRMRELGIAEQRIGAFD